MCFLNDFLMFSSLHSVTDVLSQGCFLGYCHTKEKG